MDSFSSVPPHIQPPMAQVPSAIRELTRFVPSMLMYSSMVVLLVVCSEIVIFLAKPLCVGDSVFEPMFSLVKFELVCFRTTNACSGDYPHPTRSTSLPNRRPLASSHCLCSPNCLA